MRLACQIASLWLLVASGGALAHPGHDSAPSLGFFEGLWHLLTQPDHVAMLVAALVLGGVAARGWRVRRHAGRLPRKP